MSSKNKLDKYYTNQQIAAHCVDVFKNLIPQDQRQKIIEPSAGNGAFLPFFDDIIAYDLLPEHEDIIQKDFFDVTQTYPTKITTIFGNPPFGKNSSLAIKFFNHAVNLGNTIAFIVPQTFRKLSVHKRLNLNFHLIHDEVLPKNSFLLDGSPYDVPCVFQIWQYQTEKRIITYPDNSYFEFIKKSEANEDTFCVRRVGGNAGRILRGLNHSARTTYFINAKVDWCKALLFMLWLDGSVSDISSNTAAAKSITKVELATEMKRAIEDYMLAHGTKIEYW